MISRKLLVAALALALAGGSVAEVSAATTLAGANNGKSVTAQTTTKITPKTAIGGKRIANLGAKVGAKHHHVRMSRRAMKRMKIARVLRGKHLVVSHSVKRTLSKHV